MSGATDSWLRQRGDCSARLVRSSYDARIYLERASCHEQLGYPDLAAADAYKALVLTDEVLDEAGEYHEQAVEAVVRATETSNGANVNVHRKGLSNGQNGTKVGQEEDATDDDIEVEEPWYKAVAEGHSRNAYDILARTLLKCGDLKSAWDFAERGCRAFPSDGNLQGLRAQALSIYGQGQLQKDPTWDTKTLNPRKDLPHNGHVRREIYPWNTHEPDRFSPSVLSLLNVEMSKIAPKVEVRAVELPLLEPNIKTSLKSGQPIEPIMWKQLGIFATTKIAPHEAIFHEPSILTANNRLHDPLCDACSSPLPSPTPSTPLPTCPSCDDTVFCSTACLDRAQELYHPAICGHSDFDLSARDPSPAAATDALYLLLLARTIAMAETQSLHPLDLWEIKHLWGEFTSPSASLPHAPLLPFSFQTTILSPLHLLEKLNLNIFAPETMERYDIWVVNTLMAKYRGVASAKMNPRTGMPEVCAVHWRWSLANHSCAPTVRWEWPARGPAPADGPLETGKEREQGGCMGLAARGGDEVVQWGPPGTPKRAGGIAKDEEVLNHYCDVELPVKERREWAAGALGGMCVCERCVWEAAEEQEGEGAGVGGRDG